MADAVKTPDGLGAPTVGTWVSSVGNGRVLRPGDRIGTLIQLGVARQVHVPPGASGIAVVKVESGTWVQYGTPLVTWGTASEGVLPEVGEQEAADGPLPEGVVAVVAETDGTVYLRPEPDKPPFVAVGAAVRPKDTLALVEVMKTFSPCRAAVGATVERVLVEDGGSVEAGQTLFWLRPDASA